METSDVATRASPTATPPSVTATTHRGRVSLTIRVPSLPTSSRLNRRGLGIPIAPDAPPALSASVPHGLSLTVENTSSQMETEGMIWAPALPAPGVVARGSKECQPGSAARHSARYLPRIVDTSRDNTV